MQSNNRFLWVFVAVPIVVFILFPLGVYLFSRWTSNVGVPPIVPSGPVYLQIISPHGGENLCIGEEFPIQWKSSGLKTVEIFVRIPGRGSYLLGLFPAKYGYVNGSDISTYLWTVGDAEAGKGVVPPGTIYEIFMQYNAGQWPLGTAASGGLFTIRACG